MRYQCQVCGNWVKDKFIFGLLHFCLTKEEQEARILKERQEWFMRHENRPQHDMNELAKTLGILKE